MKLYVVVPVRSLKHNPVLARDQLTGDAVYYYPFRADRS